MKRAKCNKSLTFTIFLLLYVNGAVHVSANELNGTDGGDVPNQKDITKDYSIFERITSEGQSASGKDDSPISQSNTPQGEEASDGKQGNTPLDEKNSAKDVEAHFIREGHDKVTHSDVGTEEGKATGHVQKNANLRSTSYFSTQGAVSQAYNFVQENHPQLDNNGANVEQVARGQDDVGSTENGEGNSGGEGNPLGSDKPGGKPEDASKDTPGNNPEESPNRNQEKGEKEKKERGDTDNPNRGKTSEKADQQGGNHPNGLSPDEKNNPKTHNNHSESITNPGDVGALDGEENGEGDDQTGISPTEEHPTGDAPPSDRAEKIKNTLLKEGIDLKETTSMIDNAVYNMEQFILKTKFYTTAIRNFVHFKVNHICEYSKCGANARCYIVEKDKEECRCRANYMPDDSVDYFKCIPMVEKDCSKENGNCDVNAECSIDKNKDIKCQCKFNHIGDGIFCVMGSQAKQSLCLLLLLLICLLHKFLF
uniref:Merozoite surface protein 10 n=2 Tax=Plasmodium vivax TaxID=5855 RepID=Q3MNE9_PLAVI|nr:merozoite surface protein 10 [Plasmodium vivax]